MSSWSRAHAQRLLWRAGFGGTPAEIDFWAARSRAATIDWLIRGGKGPHGTAATVGVAPRLGRALDPVNEPPPTPVGIGLREYHISVYRPAVRVGGVVFNLTNFGADAHDLQVRGPSGYRSAVSPDVAGLGGRLRFRVTLRRPGAYRLLCVKPGQVKLGMRTTLRVTRRAA